MDALSAEQIALAAQQAAEAALKTAKALWKCKEVLEEAIETYDGLNKRVVAIAHNGNAFHDALALVLEALELPPYVTRAEREAEESAVAQRWGE